jgi:hypothetical protein
VAPPRNGFWGDWTPGRGTSCSRTRPEASVCRRKGPNSSPNQYVPSGALRKDSMSKSAPVRSRFSLISESTGREWWEAIRSDRSPYRPRSGSSPCGEDREGRRTIRLRSGRTRPGGFGSAGRCGRRAKRSRPSSSSRRSRCRTSRGSRRGPPSGPTRSPGPVAGWGRGACGRWRGGRTDRTWGPARRCRRAATRIFRARALRPRVSGRGREPGRWRRRLPGPTVWPWAGMAWSCFPPELGRTDGRRRPTIPIGNRVRSTRVTTR